MRIPSFLRIELRDILIAFLTILILVLFIPTFTYYSFASDLGSKEKIMDLKDTGVVLLSSKGEPFFSFYQGKYKSFISISNIPLVTQEAVLSSEDKGFYAHPGFSIGAIVRSVVSDVKESKLSYGGSTITQQLVKNSLLNSNKNFLRKYQEIVLAQEIERRYSKREILEMYLNSVYFGAGAFGIEQASQIYFGEDASRLDLAQSAMLAGLLPAPSIYSPLGGDIVKAKIRQGEVLKKMEDQEFINSLQVLESSRENLSYKKNSESLNQIAPHFALMVLDELKERYGEEEIARSGFKVTTTLNLNWQRYAEQSVKEQVVRLAKDRVSNGAVVVEDPKTGGIVSLVGSKDWYDNSFGKVNIALSNRQPGSSFKPIVYSLALEQRLITPATTLMDVPTNFNQCPKNPNSSPNCKYSPLDFDRKFRGAVTVRRALANSLNIPSVEVMQKVGVEDVLNLVQRLGITTIDNDPSKYGLSLVLGAAEVKLLELTNVYAALANGGELNQPNLILSISDRYGNTIYTYSPSPTQVIDPGAAFQVSSILSDKSARFEEFGDSLNINRIAAVKTGTTENFKDAWTIGYTPSLAIGVWVGNNDDKSMDQIAGSLGAAPIWRDLMREFLKGVPNENFKMPKDVVVLNVCRGSQGLKKESSMSARLEFFLTGTQPQVSCPALKNSLQVSS